LIAALGQKSATFCQLLKETGARCGEIAASKWTDIDFPRKIVNITPEKGSDPRIIKLSQKALDMINNLPKDGERLFADADDMRSSFFMQRRRLAKKLSDPSILKVHFHSFRIWKATSEWHRVKDLLHVQGVLGHKNIQVTRQYIRLANCIYGESSEDDGFVIRVAHNVQEASEFASAGFDYVTGEYDDGGKIFRKRK
jgi:integrase